ncbi:MAG: Na+/H+ antiporter subunit E [Gammaproteobacteria bacterium]|nr:Na+/H+ antiporter subunit E [Gammaproteobacteria bacterium]
MTDPRKKYNQKNHLIIVFVSIFTFWFVLSGLIIPFIVFLGLVSSAFVIYIINRMDLIDEEISFHKFNITALFLYIFWLLKEIIISNIKVCLYIIMPTKKINPKIVKIKSSQISDFAHVLYANSITLTPGTVTIDIDGDKFTVHTLDHQFRESLKSDEMGRKVRATEIGYLPNENKNV